MKTLRPLTPEQLAHAEEGLLIREQMVYFEKLRSMRVSASEGLALLALAPDVPPSAEDRLSTARKYH